MKVVNPTEKDFLLSSYEYDLPAGQIAQFPCAQRGASRLMVLKDTAEPEHAVFSALPRLLPPNSLLIANNSRVMRARLKGKRPGGGDAQFLLLTPVALIQPEKSGVNDFSAPVNGLIRPAAKIRVGQVLHFNGGITLQVEEKGEFGHCKGTLFWQGNLAAQLEKSGLLPLPPYIKREPDNADLNRYQTVYASNTGSVAAPTAGLHFTTAMREQLMSHGHEWAELSLHVGYGTFSPVRCEDIRQHEMHAEYVELPEETAQAIIRAREANRPIIAVGTTSLRAIEGVFGKTGKITPYAGMINLFLYPGKPIRIASGILTNFHLPGSTLLMLVAAFTGRQRILSAYATAVASGYKFFSYGDAMLIY